MRIESLKPIEHAYKRSLFWIIKSLLKRGEGSESEIDTRNLNKILFLRPERLGDLLISLPVFDAIHRHFPNTKIGLVVSPKNISLVQDDPRIDRLYLYRKGLFRNLRLAREIRNDSYDAVVDMICDDSVTALLMSQWCAPGKPRIGVWKRQHRLYYDRSFGYRGDFVDGSSHVIPNTMQILKAFGINPGSESAFALPHITSEIAKRSFEFWKSMTPSAAAGGEVIGINFSAGASIRLWPTESYIHLIRQLQGLGYQRFLLFAVGNDRARAQRVAEESSCAVHVIPAGESIGFATALITRLALLVSPDTSMIHIGRAAQIPVIGLYNNAPKNVAMWHPYLQPDNALISDSPSSISSITPEQVRDAVHRALQNAHARVS